MGSVTRIVQGKELEEFINLLSEGQSMWGFKTSTRQYIISYDEKNRELGFHMSWKLLMPNHKIQRATNHVDREFGTIDEAVTYASENIEGPF